MQIQEESCKGGFVGIVVVYATNRKLTHLRIDMASLVELRTGECKTSVPWVLFQCSQKLYSCCCHAASDLTTCALLSCISLRRCSFASAQLMGNASLDTLSRIIATSSSDSLPSAPDGGTGAPFSWSMLTISGGRSIVGAASVLDSLFVPTSDSAHHDSCWGGTLAVEMMRLCGSTSHRAMNRRWPGFVASASSKGDTRC